MRMLKKMQGDRTAGELATDLGISGAYLSDVRAGKRNPGPKFLEKIGLSEETYYEPIA